MSNLPIFDVAGSALQAQSVRLNTIASNLSNADTPNFKAKDLDFQAALEQAAARAAPLQTTHEPHLTLLDASPRVFERAGVQPSLDGNTVDPDAERAAYGRAALEYRASLSFVESKVRSMLTAITGQ